MCTRHFRLSHRQHFCIWAVTGLDKKLMSDANMTPFDTVDDAVKEALKENKDAKIIILMDGSVTIPMVN